MKGPIREGERKPGPLVEQALRSLMSDDEKAGQDAISVIGIYDKDGESAHEKRKDTTDSDISVLPAWIDDHLWDFGVVRPVDHLPLVVLNIALDIMRLPTDGRLIPQRF